MTSGGKRGISPDWLRQQLAKLPADRGLIYKDGQAIIRCHSHAGGNEKTPSLTINVDRPNAAPGIFGCWSCGVSGAYRALAEVYEQLDQPSDTNRVTEDTGVFKHPDLIQQELGKEEYVLPNWETLPEWPEAAAWRKLNKDGRRVTNSVSGKTVRAYNGRMIERFGKTCLYLPALVYEEYVGGVYATLDKRAGSDVKSYINTPNAWTGTNLFGYDQAMTHANRRKPVWVVEGPRDCMSLAEHGQRAVALLGAANQKNPRKVNLLIDMEPPYYIIATDGDEAGRAAADHLKAAFKTAGVKSFRALLADGKDPADMDRDQILYVVGEFKKRWKFGSKRTK